MKIRDSAMPEQRTWEGFFDPARILAAFGFPRHGEDSVLDLGCGYGTFCLAAAALTRGAVHALDMEPEMIDVTAARARALQLANVRTVLRDFVARGSGLPDASVDFVMLFNVLHAHDPVALLREAKRVLVPAGRVGIIHWKPDPGTPRGPPLSIRPRPGDCRDWAHQAGLSVTPETLDLPPWHFGVIGIKA